MDRSECFTRLLGHSVIIRSECPEVAPYLPVITAPSSASSPDGGADAGTVAIRIVRRGKVMAAECDDTVWPLPGAPEEAVFRVMALAMKSVLGRMSGYTLIHGGCMTIGGKSALIAGGYRSGKTTLLLKLLTLGAALHGDDHFFLQGSTAAPLPQKFVVREGTVDLMEELGPFRDRVRKQNPSDREGCAFLDPTDFGQPWTIAPERPAAVFFLEPHFGAPGELVVCPKVEMARLLFTRTYRFADEMSRTLGDLTRFVAETGCFQLKVGDLDKAAGTVIETLRSLPGVPLPRI